MDVPVLIVNFKTYEQSIGEKGLKLARICEKIAQEYNANIAVAVQHPDLFRIAKAVDIPVLAQNIDPISPGSHTGHILAKTVKEAGANGTLINHSEKSIPIRDVEKCVEIARNVELISVCCAPNSETAQKIAEFYPEFIAIEPPRLIGSGIPVSKAEPEIVTNTVKVVRSVNSEIKVLCGAGITTGDDVKKAIELGTVGVLVASGIVKADNPEEVLVEFVENMKVKG